MASSTSETGLLIRKNAKPEGNGHYFFNDNSRYIGEFKNGLMDGKGLLYTFRKDCFKGNFSDGKKSGKGERITQNGEIIDEEWKTGVLVHSSKNVKKSDIIMGLKNHHEMMLKDHQNDKLGEKDDKKIDQIAETLFNNSSGEFKSKNYNESGNQGDNFENFSLIHFQNDISDFCKIISEPCVKKWSIEHVCLFLEKFGFGTFVNAFKVNKMDGVALLKLREHDFKDVEVVQVRDRVLIRDVIQKLRNYNTQQMKKNRKMNSNWRHSKTTPVKSQIDVKNEQDFQEDSSTKVGQNKVLIQHSNTSENKIEIEEKYKKSVNDLLIEKNEIGKKEVNFDDNLVQYSQFQSKKQVLDLGLQDIIPEESDKVYTQNSEKTKNKSKFTLDLKKSEKIHQKDSQNAYFHEKRKKFSLDAKSATSSLTNSSLCTEHDSFHEPMSDLEFLPKLSKTIDSQIKNQNDDFEEEYAKEVLRKTSFPSSQNQDINKKMSLPLNFKKQKIPFLRHRSDRIPQKMTYLHMESRNFSDPSSYKNRLTHKISEDLSSSEDSLNFTRPRKFNSQQPLRCFSLEIYKDINSCSHLALLGHDEEGKDNFSSDNNSLESKTQKSISHKSNYKRNKKKNIDFDIIEGIGPELKSFLIKKEDIQLETKIGDGLHTSVWKGVYQHTDIAIKVFTSDKIIGGRKKFLEEAEILSSLRSTYIVLFMGLCITYPQYFLLTEYMEDGSLYDNLYIKGPKFRDLILNNWSIKLKIIESIAHGMNYLHEMNVLHCDLKPSNILVF